MITYSIIKKSQLEEVRRIDAEYYQPEYLEILDRLKVLKSVPIREVAKTSKQKFEPARGKNFDYIEIAEVDLTTGEYNTQEILGENAPDRAQWVVRKDNVLVSTVRPIRNAVVLVKQEKEDLVCSSGFAILKPEKVSPQYLFTYLKTSPIIKLLDRDATATMYPAITTDDVLNAGIYLGEKSFQNEICNLVDESFGLLETSRSLHSQAEQLLLEELGIKGLNVGEDLFYTVPSKETKETQRFDAEYWQPKYERLIKAIHKYRNGHFPLLDKVENVPSTFVPQKTPDKTFKYVELANINSSIGAIDGFSTTTGRDVPSRAKRLLKSGDVIVSSVEGSLEKVALVDKEYELSLASTGFFQFRSDEILPETLLVLAKSPIMQMQLKKECSGTILTAVPKESLKRIALPIISNSIQQKIANLVQRSHTARKKAKQLLEEAKRKVEKMIEKGGDK